MRKGRGGEPRAIGGLVGRALKRPGLLAAAKVVALWPEVAGPTASAQLEPVRFTDGTLWVRPLSSVWAQELAFLAPALLERYGQLLPSVRVAGIRAVQAPPRGRRQVELPEGGIPLPPVRTARPAEPIPELPPAVVAEIRARAAASIRNPDHARRWADLEIMLRRRQIAIARARRGRRD
ncbi:MAG: DUF721 domain-containing protein [Candidatus Sericytochromatia bacterium]|nr:DUF721 domain-containing protein [Candidatus Tanganyikabacteria bacterium]